MISSDPNRIWIRRFDVGGDFSPRRPATRSITLAINTDGAPESIVWKVYAKDDEAAFAAEEAALHKLFIQGEEFDRALIPPGFELVPHGG